MKGTPFYHIFSLLRLQWRKLYHAMAQILHPPSETHGPNITNHLSLSEFQHQIHPSVNNPPSRIQIEPHPHHQLLEKRGRMCSESRWRRHVFHFLPKKHRKKNDNVPNEGEYIPSYFKFWFFWLESWKEF
jgi:hypothetical protein